VRYKAIQFKFEQRCKLHDSSYVAMKRNLVEENLVYTVMCNTIIDITIHISRLTVVSHEAKKEQSESPKTKYAMNYCIKTHGSESRGQVKQRRTPQNK